MVNTRNIDTSRPEPREARETTAEDSAADMATLSANQPLRILNDEVGSDPYNHTGRFSTPEDDD